MKTERSKLIRIVQEETKSSKFSEYSTGIQIEEEIDLKDVDLMFSAPLYDKLNKEAVQMVKRYEEKRKI